MIPPATAGGAPPTWRTRRPRRWDAGRRSSSPRWPRSRRMREIHVSSIIDAVKKLCMEANYSLEPDMLRAFAGALEKERSPAGRQVLQILQQNAELARTKKIPYCQDTGFVVCFLELGQDVHVTSSGLTEAIDEGGRPGYREGYPPPSVRRPPLHRVHTGAHTPPVPPPDGAPRA